MGRDAEAEPLLQAIASRSSRRPSASTRPTSRAGAEQSRRALSAAASLCRRRAAVQARACDPRKIAAAAVIPTLGQSLNNLATLYEKLGPPRQFRAVVQTRAGDLREGGGPEHPAVATLLNNLGQVAKVRGPLCRGRAADQAVAGDPRESAGPRSSRRGALARTISPISMSGRAATPRPSRSIERALAIRERAVGPDHPDTATSTEQSGVALSGVRAAPPMRCRWCSG